MNSDSPIRPSSRRSGFTMIEILIVVGIIALLASILLVVGRKAFGTADKVRLAAQLQTIERALDAYKTDFGSFPTTTLDLATTNADNDINYRGYRGARLLCKALIAPGPQGQIDTGSTSNFNLDRPNQDGYDGPGFRVPPRSGVFKLFDKNNTPGDPSDDELAGKVYGPYLSGSAIGYGEFIPQADPRYDPSQPMRVDTKISTFNDRTVLADANGNVILYYPVINPQPRMTEPDGYVGTGPDPSDPSTARKPLPMYRTTDNSAYLSELLFKNLLGAGWDGAINNSPSDNETAVVKGKYLLISAGSDGIFGPNNNDKNKTNDDVTNFGQ